MITGSAVLCIEAGDVLVGIVSAFVYTINHWGSIERVLVLQ